MDLKEVQAVALAAARDAASIHQRHVGNVAMHEWSNKGSADFVTHVDHEAENCILDHIRRAFPDHAIMAEESAGDGDPGWADAEWLWLVDPLDGTTNFLHGYPMYAASVAAARNGVVMAGAVVCSPTGDEWSAARGSGVTQNGRSIRVSGITDLRSSLIGTGFPFKMLHLMPDYLKQFDQVMRSSSGVRRAGSAALDLCHVAAGYFDGFWELDLKPWDYAAGLLFVEEAGGVVTGLDGAVNLFGHGGVIAGNPHIHRALTQLLESIE